MLILARRWRLPAALLVGAVLLGLAVQARGDAPLVAAIKEIDEAGLYVQRFQIHRDLRVSIDAVGAGWPQEETLFSYAWLLNLETRAVAWSMESERVKPAGHDNVKMREELLLPAGTYALYFSALGGFFPIKKELKLLKLFDLGTFSIRGGSTVAWDRYGRPADWKVIVRAAESGVTLGDDLVADPPEPELPALVAFRRVASGALHRALLEVTHPVRLRLLAVGEYVAREQGFADGAWIEDLDACLPIWQMTFANTRPAGGSSKNRVFDDLLELQPGRYLLYCATDDSHAHGAWNAPPPYDPDSWGVTLLPAGTLPADAVRVRLDPPDEEIVARIDQVGDAEFHRVGFELLDDQILCVRGLGEREHDKAFVDYGWIENAHSLETIWTMQYQPSRWAAGEARNQCVQDQIDLRAGSYYLCYLSDYAHAYPRWAHHPPHEPRAWGITLRVPSPDFRADRVRRFSEEDGPVAIVRLAPIGDDADEHVTFAIDEPMRVKLLALGEGARDEMFDYGLLRRGVRGEVLWRMEYDATVPAGGDRKNRKAEEVLDLAPGEYTLAYRSDGSHSFEDWNSDPPDEPHLWGVTLVELPAAR